MAEFTLVCDQSCDLDTHVVTHQFTADTLDEVLPNITEFLRGAGYRFDGEVELVKDDYIPLGAGTNVEFGGAGNIHSQHYFDKERNR